MTAVTLVRRSVPAEHASAGLVEALWVVRAPHGSPPRVALPDGRPAVVVRLGGAVRWVDPLTREADVIGSVVRGPRGVPQVVLPEDPIAPTWEIGARLTPYALSALRPEGFLVDDHRALGEGLDLDEAALAERLRACWAPDAAAGERGAGAEHADPVLAAARILESALVGAVRRPVPQADQDALDRVIRLADTERGLIRALDLAGSVNRTLAALFRLFAAHVGVTPAEFLSAVRLSCAVRELGVDDRGDAVRVVRVLRAYADAGYSNREVERFTGLSALDLRRALRGMEDLVATV